MSITFNQAIKIHSLKLKAPVQLGPKDVKLFINQPRINDFDMGESISSVQNVQIYVKNNQSGGNVTQIDYIGFIGSSIMTTKINDFKRVAGKKGESH